MCETCGCEPQARSKVYQFISPAFSYPDTALVELLQDHLLDTENCLFLLEDRPSLETLRALRHVLSSCPADELASEYVQAFSHTISKECPPYEAEYGQAHIFQKSHTLADIAGFYKAFGLELSPDFKDRLDHVSVELEFMHVLCLKEAYALAKGHPEEQLAVCREAQAKFLGEHLGLWVFEFAHRLEKRAVGNFYGLAGQLLTAFLAFEMRAFGLERGEVGGPDFVEPPEQEAPGCEACPLSPTPANEVDTQ
jgi:DMSO reductase family type II enzyme chaperone